MIRPSPDQPFIADALKRSAIFGKWPEWALGELTVMSRIRRYDHGELVHKVGDPVLGLFVIASGALENSRTQWKGGRMILSYVPPGETIGLAPMLDQKGALSDMRAHGATVVIFIPRTPLQAMLERHPSLLFRLTIELCQRIRLFSAHVDGLALLPLRQRMAIVLLSLSNSYGRASEAGIEIELKLSQDDLAALLSVSRQRVNTELRVLVAEGVLATRYNHLTILDRARLIERVGKDNLSGSSPEIGAGDFEATALGTLSRKR